MNSSRGAGVLENPAEVQARAKAHEADATEVLLGPRLSDELLQLMASQKCAPTRRIPTLTPVLFN